MRNARAAFIFVFITVALDMLALGVIVPVLPKLIVELKAGDIAQGAKISGIFGLVWAGMQFVFAPMLGALSDRFGRRPIILLSNLGLGLDYVFMALAPTVSWLFVGRVISGVTAASYPTASAYIADITPPEQRAHKFGMLGAAFGLGFVIGPAIGGLLGAHDLRAPFWAAAALSLANACYGFFVLPESLPREKRSKAGWHLANPMGSLRLLRSQSGLMGFAAVAFLYFLAHEALPAVFVLYTDFRYHWDERTVGLVLAAVGISSTIVSATLVGPLVKRLGERSALFSALACGAAGFAVYGLAPTGALFCVGVPLVALWGLTSPALQSLMSRKIGPAQQGQLQGVLGSLRGITGMMGPVIFTQAFAWAIHDSGLGETFSGLPYLLGSGLLLASLLVAFNVTRAPMSLRAVPNTAGEAAHP